MEAKRILRGFEPEDDRTILTIDLNREELKILYEGIKNHQIKQTRLRLNAFHAKKKSRKYSGQVLADSTAHKETDRKPINRRQQEVPLF